ncbi:hypothetical protein GC096_19505 [Paenibacillus sp. LMG 31461]|uniref:Uncharacterized protein n=1 Tax=Paenibacillus plantarum TaxID=2654975 RepID=A0ABX1XEA5_9BACL|nr:hypothetical protein [Paenibacillus plantarum]NOU66230.1 hypothetical protein [Paenibacillus plantarum]
MSNQISQLNIENKELSFLIPSNLEKVENIKKMENEIRDMEITHNNQLNEKDRIIAQKKDLLESIIDSKGWRILERLRRIRKFIYR